MSRQKASSESVLVKEPEKASIDKLEQILSRESAQPKLVGSNGEEILIPESVYSFLRQIVHGMASGQSVSVELHNPQMTTQEAADILKVSRPFFVKLLNEGEIPYIKVGKHRRVLLQDVITYKEQRQVKRRQGMKELSQFLQEEGFYGGEGVCEIAQE
ncbi:helix-turn-helix domain-containing protein [Microcoleus sp. LEGE 07076]|uniref:helix-turn-helix domain-containing protein n=1 Tax=Microcoleus sp. LEGE 07076 TaxID=915322 RepID=UPI0018811EA0|nr:helix-turn-helix domain-containing protein [Microcoleus sp. LEGE 07076]MBE9186245.1 helix-turn-helix domain-containing protein [Microcoleus sp. LEGE 07076]